MMPIPPTVLDFNPTVRISVDYLYVQSIPVLHKTSEKYKFRTLEPLEDWNKIKSNKIDMEKEFKRVINIYHTRGLKLNRINVDNEFKCVREKVRPGNLNTVAVGEHARDVNKSIRTLKEETGGYLHNSPYE